MDARRQPVEARFLPLERTEQEASALALTKFVLPPARKRRGIRLKAGAGAWRGFVAGAAVLLMVAAVVWQVIIPRLQNKWKAPAPPAALPPGGPKETPGLPEPYLRARNLARCPPPAESASFVRRRQRRDRRHPLPAWRVVLYSYEYQSDAERRVELVNHNHPGLRAHLFVAGNGGPYLVVTGDATSREHAQALRKKALQLGVSHAHVQEFTQ